MGLFSGISDLFFGDSNAGFDAANPYLEQARNDMMKYMQPYIDMGMGVAPSLQGQYAGLVENPMAMYDYFLSGYEPSKGYQMQQERMSQAAANSAAAGGMRGSPLEQTNQQELTQALLSEDMQKYLSNVMGLYGTGLQGQQGLFDTGFNASTGLAGNLANIYGTQGSLAFQGSQQKQSNMNNLLGLGIGAATGVATGNPWAGIAASKAASGFLT